MAFQRQDASDSPYHLRDDRGAHGYCALWRVKMAIASASHLSHCRTGPFAGLEHRHLRRDVSRDLNKPADPEPDLEHEPVDDDRDKGGHAEPFQDDKTYMTSRKKR